MPDLMIMKYILHIDTSGTSSLVMLAANGVVIASQRNETEREHAGMVNGMIDHIMQEAGVALAELSAVAVCSGPGSYTGLRIGLATAKGICYALDKPLIMQDKLSLFAANGTSERIAAVIPARVGEYFIGIYDKNCRIYFTPTHAFTEEVIKFVDEYEIQEIVGIANDDLISILKNTGYKLMTDINPEIWAQKTIEWYDRAIFQDIATAEPLYLKSVYIHKKTF